MRRRPQLSSLVTLCGLAWLMFAMTNHAQAQAAGSVWVFDFQHGSLVKGEVLYAGKTTYLVKRSDETEVNVQARMSGLPGLLSSAPEMCLIRPLLPPR